MAGFLIKLRLEAKLESTVTMFLGDRMCKEISVMWIKLLTSEQKLKLCRNLMNSKADSVLK